MTKERHDDKFETLTRALNRKMWDFIRETASVSTTSIDRAFMTLALWIMNEEQEDFLYEKVPAHQLLRRIRAADELMRWFSLFGTGAALTEYTVEQLKDDMDIQNDMKWYIFEYYIIEKRNRCKTLQEGYLGVA